MADEEQNGDFPYLPSGAAEVNKMIKENSNLFSDANCKVCNAVLISESQKLAHYQSKKHANKVRRYMTIHKDEEPSVKRFKSPSTTDSVSDNGEADRYKVCPVCNMTFSSRVVAESHYQGKVHAKNLKLKTYGFQAPALPPAKTPSKKKVEVQSAAPQGPAEGDPERFCSICHASFNNPLMATQHYAGKKHKKQLTKMKLLETYGPSSTPASTVKGYPCTVCNIELNSVEQYQAHISGSKHKNHVRVKKGNSTFTSPSETLQPAEPYPTAPLQEDWGNYNQDYE
ncbi:zinc finger protein 346 [Anguilla anguilla]|uniref:zinc finger protein 346 n=1 Tax=Anguilla anguilla TaxID=7936 RepID=UPI0015AD493E|nr:zinc finger protein 346 [Anguilla anguilla]